MKIDAITPRLIVSDPDSSIRFYQQALSAELEQRYERDGIVVHAALRIGETRFSVAAEVTEWGWLAPKSLGGSAVLLSLEVEDAKSTAAQMVAAGATVVVPVEDRPYGQCEGRLQDPFGHLWVPTHRIGPPLDDEPVSGASVLTVHRIVADLTVSDTGASVEFYRRLLDLDSLMNLGWVATMAPVDQPKRQLTVLEDDATASLNPHLSVEVDDLDLAWQRAAEIGAEIAYERTIEPWGVERFFVRDPSGNVINVLTHVKSTGT